jgi:hypothetical protein
MPAASPSRPAACGSGDYLRLEGKIAGFKFDSTPYGMRLGFIIFDFRISRAKNETP